MAEIALRQIRAIIAVVRGRLVHPRRRTRERDPIRHFPARGRGRAHARHQTVRALGHGVTPTPAGQLYYKRCIEAVSQIANANEEVRGFAARVSGDLRIGLIPTVTRAALAPPLADFKARYPDVRLHIVEGYSGWLTEMVHAGELDFAVVPAVREPRRLEITADRARPRNAGVEPEPADSRRCSRCG